ncbi:lipoate--protein ligase LplA, partial [Vibrio parahaemolyticus]|nr:lipoate--protein ligase LplA [Vibrio parahaemolyticus]
KTALEPCLAQLMQELPQYQLPLEEFQRWFIDQID